MTEAQGSTRSAERGEIPTEDRGGYRDYMFELAGGPMRFEVRARKALRHPTSATMVCQLLFWDGKGSDPKGYVWKTYEEWWEEWGLTRTGLDTARRKLGKDGLGILDEERRGVPCRMFYRLNLTRLFEVMFPELDPPTADDPVPEDRTLNQSSRVQGSSEQVCGDASNKFAGFTPSHIREIVRDNNRYSPHTPQGGSRKRKGKAQENGGSATPEQGIHALREWTAKSGRRELERFASLAEKFDFTSEEEPPWPILARLGSTEDERLRNLKRCRNISRRGVRGSSTAAASSAEVSTSFDLSPDDVEAMRREILNWKSAANHHARFYWEGEKERHEIIMDVLNAVNESLFGGKRDLRILGDHVTAILDRQKKYLDGLKTSQPATPRRTRKKVV